MTALKNLVKKIKRKYETTYLIQTIQKLNLKLVMILITGSMNSLKRIKCIMKMKNWVMETG